MHAVAPGALYVPARQSPAQPVAPGTVLYLPDRHGSQFGTCTVGANFANDPTGQATHEGLSAPAGGNSCPAVHVNGVHKVLAEEPYLPTGHAQNDHGA